MRPLDPAVEAAIDGTEGTACWAVWLEVPGDPLLATTAPFEITFDVDGSPATFVGVGDLGAVAGAEESASLSPDSLALTLSGVSPEVIARAKGSAYRNRRGRVWLVLLDEAFGILGAPAQVYEGRMDAMASRDANGVGTVSLTVDDALIDWARPRMQRLTDEAQQARFPGDRGCEFVAGLRDRPTVDEWGG